jgi:hypothetical protein
MVKKKHMCFGLLRTFSAHTPDNTFLGFVVLPSSVKSSAAKGNYSLVMGKESQYIVVSNLLFNNPICKIFLLLWKQSFYFSTSAVCEHDLFPLFSSLAASPSVCYYFYFLCVSGFDLDALMVLT